MEIIFTKSLSGADLDFLTKKINEETPDYGKATSWSFLIRDRKSQIIAGANGSIIFGSIYTDQLWVDKNYRKLGYGKKLMARVHNYGLEEGCNIATVTTMTFQGARHFYEKLGYLVDFERSG